MKGTREGGGGGGEIVQVDGGLILRSTGRKDRHSKVYTSKGPRDRRVRLSAHTAIQFYDVQDRLGYDRPSKAVDWLIKKAKSAIDKLCERDTNSNPRDHQSETHSEFASSSFLADQPDAHFVNTMRSFFPGFSSDGSVSRESFQGEDHLGLSLQTFQESFQRSDGGSWNVSGEIEHGTASFSNRELLQSNLAVNPWSQRLLSYSDHHNSQPCCSKPSDFGTPFDLGFPVQATIYGEEEADDPSSFKC